MEICRLRSQPSPTDGPTLRANNMTHITKPSEVDPVDLSVAAFEILTKTLEDRQNSLSGGHAVALLKLMQLFTGYVAGTHGGRRAYPLPTGMGKTTGVVAFIAAMHQLGYRIPVAVAASQIQALVTLKRDLMAAGVPEADIGLAHRDPSADEPSTGCSPEDGRLVQLVTHARVRMGDDYLGLLAQYQGHPRALLVFDETLFRSDAFAFLISALGGATASLAYAGRNLPALAAPLDYLQAAVGTIEQAMAAARGGSTGGAPVELPEVHPEVLEVWKLAIGKVPTFPRGYVDVLHQFLDVSQMPLQALPMTQGGGAVAVRQAVSQQLANVVVLDASTPIRDLVSLDQSIEVYAPIDVDKLKSFQDVEVMQLLAAGGRSSIEQTFGDKARETSTVSREVVDIVKEEIQADPQRCILVFTFKKSPRSDLDIKSRLQADLKLAGIDPDEVVTTADGLRPRVTFLHWGQHEGLNGFEYCQTVVMAGVLHRSHLDIAASIKGQKLDLSAPTPHDLVTQVIKSEVAHCVYQAASRGSCRRVSLGKAKAMRLWLIHQDAGLRDVLDKVMPQAQWSYPDPKHIKKSTLGAVGVTMRGRILDALRGLPADVTKVSVQALKKAMGNMEGSSDTFTRALDSLDINGHGWMKEGKSLVRATAAAYGF